MDLVTWKPFGGELRSFPREMDRFWNRILGATPFIKTFIEKWVPLVDVSETKDAFIVKAEKKRLNRIHRKSESSLWTFSCFIFCP